MADIVLTADKTLMSDYHKNEFLGFGTCAPPNFIPDWLFSHLFFPTLEGKHGQPWMAPYGLRKTEAQLLKDGFQVETVSPEHLKNSLNGANVLGIHVMDPFGLGPASSTLSCVLKKEPYLARNFQALLKNPAVKQAKQRGLKVIVGGPGAWQFRYREKSVKDLGIDCVIEGEAENVIGKLFSAAVENQPIPAHYEVKVDEVPSIEQIPDIVNPSINGLVEIGRGCCRGCTFCNVTLRPLRWYPIEKVQRELMVNVESNKVACTCLHAEDVMLYGSNNTSPNEQKILQLHELVVSNCKGISWSHCSLAAIISNPELFSKISEIIRQNQHWWGAEIGIETGSTQIAKKIMPAKARPFRAQDWKEVVVDAMGLAHDNMLVPACTIIAGLPDEREEDVLATLDLVDDLKDMRSLIVPLFFVPLGRLGDREWFNYSKLNKRQWDLLFKCCEHNFRWVDELLDWSVAGRWYSPMLRGMFKVFAAILKRKLRQVEIAGFQND